MHNALQPKYTFPQDSALLPNIEVLRQAFLAGRNIADLLTNNNPNLSREDIVEISYEIQSGTYTEFTLGDPGKLEEYAKQIYQLSKDYVGTPEKARSTAAPLVSATQAR